MDLYIDLSLFSWRCYLGSACTCTYMVGCVSDGGCVGEETFGIIAFIPSYHKEYGCRNTQKKNKLICKIFCFVFASPM